MNAVLETGESAIWKRIIQPDAAGWSSATARAILDLDFQNSDRQRMSELLERATSGALGEEEARQLEDYRHVGTTLELMQSRARLSLKGGQDA